MSTEWELNSKFEVQRFWLLTTFVTLIGFGWVGASSERLNECSENCEILIVVAHMPFVLMPVALGFFVRAPRRLHGHLVAAAVSMALGMALAVCIGSDFFWPGDDWLVLSVMVMLTYGGLGGAVGYVLLFAVALFVQDDK